eukprot:TRINITY_DN2188_c0_g1_i2.p1 TRINITY_DN2188_c0_g1~~TRINITY_DN2188_c0_g1_i2.p1  ORF type:complete len:103 (-),score=9.87 TRINITY_DN2188_c0_g1_i2:81-389(-)
MVSHSYSYSSLSSLRSSSSSSSSTDVLFDALKVDRPRFGREFFTPEPISMSGNYYPRYQVTGGSLTGTGHVSYLSRPLHSYKVPSILQSGNCKYVGILLHVD